MKAPRRFLRWEEKTGGRKAEEEEDGEIDEDDVSVGANLNEDIMLVTPPPWRRGGGGTGGGECDEEEEKEEVEEESDEENEDNGVKKEEEEEEEVVGKEDAHAAGSFETSAGACAPAAVFAGGGECGDVTEREGEEPRPGPDTTPPFPVVARPVAVAVAIAAATESTQAKPLTMPSKLLMLLRLFVEPKRSLRLLLALLRPRVMLPTTTLSPLTVPLPIPPTLPPLTPPTLLVTLLLVLLLLLRLLFLVKAAVPTSLICFKE